MSGNAILIFFFVFLFCVVCFLGPHLQHMEVPRLGVELELQLLAYATATATPDPSHTFHLHHSSWQCQILYPLKETRDRTHNLMDLRFFNRWAMEGTPGIPEFRFRLPCLIPIRMFPDMRICLQNTLSLWVSKVRWCPVITLSLPPLSTQRGKRALPILVSHSGSQPVTLLENVDTFSLGASCPAQPHPSPRVLAKLLWLLLPRGFVSTTMQSHLPCFKMSG